MIPKVFSPLMVHNASKIILTAFEIGVFEELQDGARARSELACKLGLDSVALGIFLDVLCKLDIVTWENGQYALLPHIKNFLEHPSQEFQHVIASHRCWSKYWANLGDCIKSGASVASKVSQGKNASPWEEIGSESARVKAFANSMNAKSSKWVDTLTGGYPWEATHKVVDLGCGKGTHGIALAKHFPGLQVTLFDLPTMTPIVHSEIIDKAVSNATFVPGSFFNEQSIPRGADIYIMSWILHDWNDCDAERILDCVFNAMPSSSKLVLFEYLIACGMEVSSDPSSSMARLSMLLYFGSRERTLQEYRTLLKNSGFVNIQCNNESSNQRSIIIAEKP